MKIICPKCQFENQTDANRIVCARCATLIEVHREQGTAADFDSKRQTRQLPFTGNNGQPRSSNSLNQPGDMYATRSDYDFEDVLELPRHTPPVSYQATSESEAVFNDVFMMPSYDALATYDASRTQPNQTAPVESPQPVRQRQTQDHTGTPKPASTNWPARPVSAYARAEQAVGAPNNRGGWSLRVVLALLIVGVLSLLVYALLWDQTTNRPEQTENLATGQISPTPAPKPSIDQNIIAAGRLLASEPPKPTPTAAPAGATTANDATKSGTLLPVPPSSSESKLTPTPNTPAITTPRGGNLALQIGSFPDQGQANARAAKLREAGTDARVTKAKIPGKGTWYRVQLGDFKSPEEAKSFGNQLRSKGAVQDFIVTPLDK